MPIINLYDYQIEAINKMKTGSILCGGVGSGKSRTALAYYYLKECRGELNINGDGNTNEMMSPKDLYIITTAKKRDSLEWMKECVQFLLSNDRNNSISNVLVTFDSWNNIKKYIDVKNAFFIFDEQRIVGSGTWVKSFLKISKNNNWLLLSATPGDDWSDYIPVFIANGFYKNKTDFVRQHVIFSPHTVYPKIDRYIEQKKLHEQKQSIIIWMKDQRRTLSHHINIRVHYDLETYKSVRTNRWNIYKDSPIKNAAELCYTLRKIVNTDKSRADKVLSIYQEHKRVIIFYNFTYELDILRETLTEHDIIFSEWNGQKHEPIMKTDTWCYLVQYTAGAEGWECITTNTIIFYSQNYSYKMMVQAAGRIDRINTTYDDLYYYHLISGSSIDTAIKKALKEKKEFNEKDFDYS